MAVSITFSYNNIYGVSFPTKKESVSLIGVIFHCLMQTIFKVFIEFVTILLLFYVLVSWPWGMWGLNSSARDQTHTLCIGRWSLNHRITMGTCHFLRMKKAFLGYSSANRTLRTQFQNCIICSVLTTDSEKSEITEIILYFLRLRNWDLRRWLWCCKKKKPFLLSKIRKGGGFG